MQHRERNEIGGPGDEEEHGVTAGVRKDVACEFPRILSEGSTREIKYVHQPSRDSSSMF